MPGARLTKPTELAIIADYTARTPRSQLASKYKCSTRTIDRVISDLRKAPVQSVVSQDRSEWKSRVTGLSVLAVERALVDESDNYRAASIGQVHLKGVGEYAPDNSLTINQLVQSVPQDWRERYLAAPQSEAIEGTSGPALSRVSSDNDSQG